MSIQEILNTLKQSHEARLFIKVLPQSAFNKITEISTLQPGQFQLKVKLTTQPIENKANKALIELLHRQFHLPKFCFRIILGNKSKNKTILISLPT